MQRTQNPQKINKNFQEPSVLKLGLWISFWFSRNFKSSDWILMHQHITSSTILQFVPFYWLINAHKSVTKNSDLPILRWWGGFFKKTLENSIFFIFDNFPNWFQQDYEIYPFLQRYSIWHAHNHSRNENRIFGIGKIYPMPNFEINPVFISIPEVASSFHIIPCILFEVDYEVCASFYIEFTIWPSSFI